MHQLSKDALRSPAAVTASQVGAKSVFSEMYAAFQQCNNENSIPKDFQINNEMGFIVQKRSAQTAK